jgi:pilus assembly protein CpaB
MRAKTILTLLFVVSIGVAALVILRGLPQGDAATEAASGDEILVATAPLVAGTLLRAQDVTWQRLPGVAETGEYVRPGIASAIPTKVAETDDEVRTAVYGAALRSALAAGDPIRRSGIIKPGDRDFLQFVLSPGARAIAIPVATSGASTGLLYPGDRVDVILTQNFKTENAPLTRRSVSETVVENLRVVAIDALDAKVAGGRTVTMEVAPDQAEKIQVAVELGKLSLTLRSVSRADGVATASTAGPGKASGVKPTWAGDVSPALGGALPPDKVLAAEHAPVEVFRGSKRGENVKPE